MWLLPPSLDELLPLDHPARFVAEFVDASDRDDWAELGVEMEGDPLGAPAYHPRALLSVWLYGFMTGVRSCRKLETACRDQIPYLWLSVSDPPSRERVAGYPFFGHFDPKIYEYRVCADTFYPDDETKQEKWVALIGDALVEWETATHGFIEMTPEYTETSEWTDPDKPEFEECTKYLSWWDHVFLPAVPGKIAGRV